MFEGFQFQIPTPAYFGEDFIQKIGAKTEICVSRVLIVDGAMPIKKGGVEKN